MKAAMEIVTGIKVGPPREPLEPLTEEMINQLREALKELNFGRMK